MPNNSYPFTIGNQYQRKDIFIIVGMPSDTWGGNWFTGYARYGEDDWFLFCNIGISGRTGHDYNNHFRGDDLVWYGKTNSKLDQPAIQSMISGQGHVYVFYREDNKNPFTYAGRAIAKQVFDTSPVSIIWGFGLDANQIPEFLPQEIIESEDQVYTEGKVKQIVVNSYERNPLARQKCIQHYGLNCCVCGFNFEKVYGSIGQNYIQVHHLLPLSDTGEEYVIDPIRDLRPVCPNCHAMLHKRNPPYTINGLRRLISEAKGE